MGLGLILQHIFVWEIKILYMSLDKILIKWNTQLDYSKWEYVNTW